jgi:hypothetical protein
LRSVVPDDVRDPEPVVGEDAAPPRRRVPPEGERERLARLAQALEPLDRREAVGAGVFQVVADEADDQGPGPGMRQGGDHGGLSVVDVSATVEP